MSASGESADGCPILNPNKGKEVVDEPELVHNDSTIINSTNNMPDLRNAKQSWQKLDLPKEREKVRLILSLVKRFLKRMLSLWLMYIIF